MNLLRTALVLSLAAGSAACFGPLKDLFDSPTTPTDTTAVRSYLGTWVGPETTSYPTAQSCGNVQWKVTSQTGAQITGDFQAACSGGMTLAGTMVGTHGETTIPWAASGTATQGSVTCPFTMTGTGTFQGTSNILVTYTGTSCAGPLTGTETIKR